MSQNPLLDTFALVVCPKTPSKEDWERWRPFVTDLYKQQTARLVAERLRAQGYHVTKVEKEKMVKDRLRQWKLNDKIRKPPARPVKDRVQRELSDTVSSQPTAEQSQSRLLTMGMAPDDRQARKLLSLMDSWYDDLLGKQPLELVFLEGRTWMLALIDVIGCGLELLGTKAERVAFARLREAGPQARAAFAVGNAITPLYLLEAISLWSRHFAGPVLNTVGTLLAQEAVAALGQHHPISVLARAVSANLDAYPCDHLVTMITHKMGISGNAERLPDLLHIQLVHANILVSQNRPAAAAELLGDVIVPRYSVQIGPQRHAELLWHLAVAKTNQQDFPGAADVLMQASSFLQQQNLSRSRQNIKILGLQGNVFMAMGATRQSETVLREALDIIGCVSDEVEVRLQKSRIFGSLNDLLVSQGRGEELVVLQREHIDVFDVP